MSRYRIFFTTQTIARYPIDIIPKYDVGITHGLTYSKTVYLITINN
jgi:hypothetical protein